MSENDRQDETQPVRPEAGTTPPAGPLPPPPAAGAPASPAGPASPAPPGRRGFRERFRRLRHSDGDRAFSLGALVASALAGLIVGSVGTAVFHAVVHDGPRERSGWVQRDDRGDRDGWGGWGGWGDRGGRGEMRGGPRDGVPGQLPPTTPPEDDSAS